MTSSATGRIVVVHDDKCGTCSIGAQEEISKSDDDLMLVRLREGGEGGLSDLFRRYAKLLRSIAARILRDSAEADDLVQDLFFFIQRKAGTFDSSKGSARSWIVQMAYQRAIERRRYLATRHFYAQVALQSEVESVVSKPTIEDDYSPKVVFGRNGLEKAFAELSEDQRETLRLCFFEGYTFAEISGKLGQPVGNVRHHYYRALDKLRKEMFANRHARGV